jgi:ABC-type transport system involved in multi-copper enzyme maturation permease subunit
MAISRASMRDDFQDTYLSLKFELVKYVKHRRLLIMAALAIIIPLVFYAKVPDTAPVFAVNVLSFANVLIVISAAMFAGDTVCGEFEKKTSLLLFPTPQSRFSIFAGKYIAALTGTFAAVLLYYITMTLQIWQLYGWGNIPTELGKSLLTALIYAVSAVSVIFLFSSILKRSIASTIVGFLFLVLVLPVLTLILTLLNQEPWFIVTYSANLIPNVIGATSNLGPGGNHPGITVFEPTFGVGVAVMIVYAAVGLTGGLLMAIRKED